MYGDSHPQQGKSERILGLILLLSTLAAYWFVLRCDFVFFDDPSYITENPQVRMGLNRTNIIWAFTTFHSSNWHPLTWLSHMLDCDIYGLNPAGHHLTNLLFHAGNALLLFLFLREATGTRWRSFFVAALFSLHPLHVESVAWVSERKDVLSTFFGMLTLMAYLRYVEQPGIWRYLLVVFPFCLGLTAKPMLVTLPFALLLLDYWPLVRVNSGFRTEEKWQWKPWVPLFIEKMPLILLSLASCVVTYLAQSEGGAVVRFDGLPFGFRIGNALVAYAGYLLNMVCPTNLTIFYPHPGASLEPWLIVVSALLLIGLSGLIIRQAPARPYYPVGWFWYLGTLTPVIGLIQVGDQAMADRYTYIPLIGIFVAIVWGLEDLFRRSHVRRIVLVSFLCTIFAALFICTQRQVLCWQTTATLFERALRVTKNNYLAHFTLSQLDEVMGRPDKAQVHYARALEINPSFVAKMHNRNGYYLTDQGQLDLAQSEFERAIRIFPGYANALNNLGVVLAKKGLYEEALSRFAESLRISPGETKVLESIRNVELDRARQRNTEGIHP